MTRKDRKKEEKKKNTKDNKIKRRNKKERRKNNAVSTTAPRPRHLHEDSFIVAYAQIHALVFDPPVDCKNQPGLEAAARLGGQGPDVPGSLTNEG